MSITSCVINESRNIKNHSYYCFNLKVYRFMVLPRGINLPTLCAIANTGCYRNDGSTHVSV